MLTRLLNRWRRYREDRAVAEGQLRQQLDAFKQAEMIKPERIAVRALVIPTGEVIEQ